MGKLSRGFLGGFQGQLGTAYGCFWRLMDLIKAMPRKSNRPATEKQLEVQARLSLMTSFLSWAGSIIKMAYFEKKSNQSAMNAAVAYNLENSITGVAPLYAIDYPKLRLSTGRLEKAFNLTMSTVVDAELKFEWELNSAGTQDSNPTDKLSFVVYNPSKQKFVILKDVAIRSALTYDLIVPSNYSGDNVYVYVIITRADGEMASETDYAGATVVM